MSRTVLSEDYLPAYIDINPLKRMKKVAGNIAMAKKAIAQIATIEDAFFARGDKQTVDEAELARTEMIKYAKIIAKNARLAARTLKVMSNDVAAYRKELSNATG